MMSNNLSTRIAVALLFAIAFAVIGWTMPALYAVHAPADTFIEVNDFSAQNASTDAESHYICFDRDMKQSTSGTIYTELYLVTDGGERVEIAGNSMERYFQSGEHIVISSADLPDELKEGEYRYLLVVNMELSDNRVERTFAYTSNSFYIGDEYSDDPQFDGEQTC